MWARIIELMLACWLSLSPFIFHHPSESTFLWNNDLVCGAFVALLALLSFWNPIEKIHLAIFPISVYLVIAAFTNSPSPAIENHLVLGLLLAMLSLVPSHAESPPRQWIEFLKKRNRL
ncbi:MAG TPA: SPW repeat protein [Chlamydiales bacterium]